MQSQGAADGRGRAKGSLARASLAALVALIFVTIASGAVVPCPTADSTNGIFATGYTTSEGETVTDGVLAVSGSITFDDPAEIAGNAIASHTLTITCAETTGNGCDDQDSTTPGVFGDTSACMGCAGTVSATVQGVGSGNPALSTCIDAGHGDVTCTEDGTPSVDGVEAQGIWTASGDCDEADGMGQGSCACEAWDGAVVTPDGPWQITESADDRCTCSEIGTAIAPPAYYASSYTADDAYYDPATSVEGCAAADDCSCNAEGVATNVTANCGCSCTFVPAPTCDENSCGCGDESTYPADGTVVTNDEGCGCTCTETQDTVEDAGCACERRACTCACTQECIAQCTPDPCQYDTSEDGKTFTSTGGYTCEVRAQCSGGFYGGGSFTALTASVKANLKKVDTDTGQTYLTGHTQSLSSGSVTFNNLRVVDTASNTVTYKLNYGVWDGSDQVVPTDDSDAFDVAPYGYTVRQASDSAKGYTTAPEYVVGTDQTAELGEYKITLTNSDGSAITDVDSDSGFSATFTLITSTNGDDTLSYNVNGDNTGRDVSSQLIVKQGSDEVTDRTVNIDVDGTTMVFDLAVRGMVGQPFEIGVHVDSPYTTSKSSDFVLRALVDGSPAHFILSPSSVVVHVGVVDGTPLILSSDNYPKVLHMDGDAALAEGMGIPSPFTVQFLDSDGDVIAAGNSFCQNCVAARLVRCDDAYSGQTSYPTCSSVSQALCAAHSDGKCGEGDADWRHTLSGRIVVDMVDGNATFTDLQVSHTWGAGFRIEFYLNPDNFTATTMTSLHQNGWVSVPPADNDAGSNSIFVRPYEVVMYRQPGGDGVDNDGDGNPDGVGVGVVFRFQPWIRIAGKGYSLAQNNDLHGYTPVQVVVYSQKCGATVPTNESFPADCQLQVIGYITPPAEGKARYVMQDSYDMKTDAEKMAAYVDPTGDESLSATKPQIKWSTGLGNRPGIAYSDLRLSPVNATRQHRHDVVLEFRIGPNAADMEHVFTSVRADPIDMFHAPNAPSNIRATTVGTLGFRVDWDPPVVTRNSPLTGFVVEVQRCSRTETQNATCIDQANPSYDARHGFARALGSDLSLGGGLTQEVLFAWGVADEAGVLPVEIYFKAERTLAAGDAVLIELGARLHMLDEFASACALEGPDAELLEVSVATLTSTLQLTVTSGATVYEQKHVNITIPASCNIHKPYSGPRSSTNVFGYLADFEELSLRGSTLPVLNDNLPDLLHCPVMGGGSRFDNCKGTLRCDVAARYELVSIKDENSMDLDWSGDLYYGGHSGYFGQNGKLQVRPDGATEYPDSDEACRSGSALTNPCALSIGHDWTDAVALSYSPTTTNGIRDFNGVNVTIRRARGLAPDDLLVFELPWDMTMTGSADCEDLITEHANHTVPNTTLHDEGSCDTGFLITTAHYRGEAHMDWVAYWSDGGHAALKMGAKTFGIKVPRTYPALPFEDIEIEITGFTATSSQPAGYRMPRFANALVRRGRRTSLVFRDGAMLGEFYSKTTSNPLGHYRTVSVDVGTLAVTGESVYNFKVTPHNGRFTGPAVETQVQNRAITPPAPPALFSQMSQEVLGVRVLYSNYAGQVVSGPFPKYTVTVVPESGEATRVGVRLQPKRRIGAGESFTLKLPGFSAASPYVIWNASSDYKIWADTYQVTAGSHGACACDAAGTTFTPRNLYRLTAEASGVGKCGNGTADADLLAALGVNESHWIIDADFNNTLQDCECGGCSCSLSGIPSTPATIYNEAFNCSGCSCDHSTGEVTLPPTEYTAGGNCSDCTCSSRGVGSASPNYHAVGECDNCACSGINVSATPTAEDADCSACSCEYRTCDCTCEPISCDCSCPVNRSCTCGCPLQETFECGCEQRETAPEISRAVWSAYTQQLTLTIAKGHSLPAGRVSTFWLDRAGGLTLLGEDKVPKGPDGLSGGEALFNRFKLNWLSPFPTAIKPRLGFLVQMTSDIYWRTNIQSFFVPDVLDSGTERLAVLSHLAQDVAKDDVFIEVADAQRHLYRGDIIKVGDEYMEVQGTANASTAIEVKRGVLESTAQAHPVTSGTAADGGTCACAANHSATGGGSCACTPVHKKFRGATDVSVGVEKGLDRRTGFLGTQCRSGVKNAPEGCNPTGYLWNSTRTHQTFEITEGVTHTNNFYGACGTDPETCDSSNCRCKETEITPGQEMGNIASKASGVADIRNTGDPLAFPASIKTTTMHAVLDEDYVTSVAVASAAGIQNGMYIRVDEEIMLVKLVSRGVLQVATSKTSGGSACSCSAVGATSSGGGACACRDEQAGADCVRGGTLVGEGGSGNGFRAVFTVDSGSVDAITVQNPGSGYKGAGPKVSIYADTSDCTFSSPTWFVTTSDSVLFVERAVLGTIRGEHASGAVVSIIPWPTFSAVNTHIPGLQYHFRIAAVNSAGVSTFLYHELKLYSVFPRVIPGAGERLLEVILIGGHSTASNITLYVGQTLDDGSPDFAHSKRCDATSNLDAGGTRLTCSSPPGNGAAWDLIAVSKSGSVNRINVGSAWMRYEKPVITRLSPVQVKPEEPVTFTITGKHFGLPADPLKGRRADPLSGYLETEESGQLRCAPLVHLSDGAATCTITPKKGQIMQGHMVLWAGDTAAASTTGGAQDTATDPEVTYVKEEAKPVEVKAAIPVEINSIPEGSPERKSFEASFATDISGALGVPSSRIEIVGISAGSVIVIFNILPDPNAVAAPSPAALAVSLAQQAADPSSALAATALGGAITVTIPPGTAELAQAEVAAASVEVGSVPLWESSCVAKTYTSFDMEVCYDCCTYICETGVEVPQVGGQDALPGYRAEVCQSRCLSHCGYDRVLSRST